MANTWLFGEEKRRQELHEQQFKEFKEKLIGLLGKRVVKVYYFDEGTFDSGYVIEFEDGSLITAQDGEYGDNAIEFLDEKPKSSKELKNRR